MGDIVVFDTETTGLPEPDCSPVASQPRMIEFAGIKLNQDLEEIDRIEFFVDPCCEIPTFISNLTGIKNQHVANAGDFSYHVGKLQQFFLGVEELVAHNLAFDNSILKYELQRLDKVCQFPWPPKLTCTVEKTIHLQGKPIKLSVLHELLFGNKFEGAHRAMTDVEALTRVYLQLRENGTIV